MERTDARTQEIPGCSHECGRWKVDGGRRLRYLIARVAVSVRCRGPRSPCTAKACLVNRDVKTGAVRKMCSYRMIQTQAENVQIDGAEKRNCNVRVYCSVSSGVYRRFRRVTGGQASVDLLSFPLPLIVRSFSPGGGCLPIHRRGFRKAQGMRFGRAAFGRRKTIVVAVRRCIVRTWASRS